MLPEIFGTGFGGALLNLQKSLGQGLGGTFETLKSMLSEIFGTGFGGHLKTGHFGLSFETDGLRIFL